MICKKLSRVPVKHCAIRSQSNVPLVPNFIDGKFVQSSTHDWIELRNPATQDLVCKVPETTDDELRAAEYGAKRAFETWKEVPVQQRQVSKL